MTTPDGGIPDGSTSLTPFLVCSPAREAIAFYEAVLGARVVSVMDGPGGTVAHAELQLPQGRLQLADPSARYGLVAPARDGVRDGDSSSVCAYLPDVDAAFARAVERGAVVREEPSTFVTGDRFASLHDPYGHRWALMTRVEDVSDEEAERRLAAWAADQQPG